MFLSYLNLSNGCWERLTPCIKSAADRNDLTLSQLWECVKYLKSWLPTRYLETLGQTLLLRKSTLKKSEKNGTEKLMGLMKCFRNPQQKDIFPLFGWANIQSIWTSELLWPCASFSIFSFFDDCRASKASKSVIHDGIWKHRGNFRTSLVAALIGSIEKVHFSLFIFEKAIGELTSQPQTRQMRNESLDPD